MLVRLFGENFRSFRDPFELSMMAADYKNEDDRGRGVVEVEIDGQDEPLTLLRSAAIYGANASGKSTVVHAANALRWMIQKSSRKSESGKSIPPYEPFLLDKKKAKAPVRLGCTVAYDRVLYEYEIVYTKERIESERLEKITEDVETLFERNSENKASGELIDQSEAVKLYVQDMQPNVAVLSKLAQHGPADGAKGSVIPYYKALLSVLGSKDYAHTMSGRRLDDPIAARMQKNKKFKQWVMNTLICPADVGIVGVEVEDFDIPEEIRNDLASLPGVKIPAKFVGATFVHSGSADSKIDFDDESAGTQKLYHLAEDWWDLAHEEITLFMDELCASLHPRLLDVLVRNINGLADDVKRSQVIFTTHDTGLLEGRDGKPAPLRRDQVYFTKKKYDGASELYSLAEFKDEARGVHNIRKRYMSGLYGALPMVEGVSFERAT